LPAALENAGHKRRAMTMVNRIDLFMLSILP